MISLHIRFFCFESILRANRRVLKQKTPIVSRVFAAFL